VAIVVPFLAFGSVLTNQQQIMQTLAAHRSQQCLPYLAWVEGFVVLVWFVASQFHLRARWIKGVLVFLPLLMKSILIVWCRLLDLFQQGRLLQLLAV
jgi:hypothetical protein